MSRAPSTRRPSAPPALGRPDDSTTADVDESIPGGQLWRFTFAEGIDETPLPVITPPSPPGSPAPEPQPSPSPSPRPSPQPSPAPGSAAVTKVLVFVEENHSLPQMQAGMPFTFSQAQRFGYATGYRAITHPSLPNYIAIASGSTHGVTDDGPPARNAVPGPSVFGQAIAAGGTARAYAEGMATNRQATTSGRYAVKHNPWPYFTAEAGACARDDVPETRLAARRRRRCPADGGHGHSGSLQRRPRLLAGHRRHVVPAAARADLRPPRLALRASGRGPHRRRGRRLPRQPPPDRGDAPVAGPPRREHAADPLQPGPAARGRGGGAHLGNATTAPDMAAAFGLPVR